MITDDIPDKSNTQPQTADSSVNMFPQIENSSPKPLVVPPKDQPHTPQPPPKFVPKKQGGKGMLIGILLFFILTLPVAIYYGSQQYSQITEQRSRAALIYNYQCTTADACTNVLHGTSVTPFASSSCVNCQPGGSDYATKPVCCQTQQYITPAATRTPTPGSCRNPGDYPAHCVGNCPSGQQCVVESSYTCHCISATNTPTRVATRTPIPTRTPTQASSIQYRCVDSGYQCAMSYHGAAVALTNCSECSTTCCRTDIIERGCIGGTLIPIQKSGFSCTVCSHGGIMTCDGPSGGSGGDPCQVKFSDQSVVSATCEAANMIRCNCGGNAWVGGRPGVTCAQLCICADIVCDQCTPTPTQPHTTTNTPPESTHTPTPTRVITNTPTISITQTITMTPTITTTSTPGTCDASCDSDENCESGLLCYSIDGIKRCRKEACPNESNCECPENTPTPTTRYYVENTPINRVVVDRTIVVTATQQPTPKVPVSGIIDVKAVVITIGSILLLALGLLL